MEHINKTIKDLRRDYDKGQLKKDQITTNPFDLFEIWFNDALESKSDDPHAMNLATVDNNGRPSSRVVLLRNADDRGFVFFTNYRSKKGIDLDAGRPAAINFFWPQLQRQIRIEGICERVDKTDSTDYFNSRPYESKIGALASKQSSLLESREELDESYESLEKQFKDSIVERPEYWGGYRLIPDYFEFWQGRLNRLHDRFIYNLVEDNWDIARLYP